MKIAIVTHKDKCFLNNSIFYPVQVNAKKNNYVIDENYFLDNVGDNISIKNENYCELTALYFMWKNIKNEDVLGLNHYRRYFHFLNYSLFKPHRIIEIDSSDKLIEKHNQNADKIKDRVRKWLQKNDVILPFVRKTKHNKKYISISDEYKTNHIASDWNVTMKIIQEKYPEYSNSISKYLDNNNEIYLMNIFIAKSEWVNKYCEWLFSILFEVEKNISISDDNYQKRVFGFLSERLLTLYVKHNNFKVKELPLLFVKNLF